jgi:hypothetical protein
MSILSGNTTVGTTATLIDSVAWQNPVLLHIHNNDNTEISLYWWTRCNNF